MHQVAPPTVRQDDTPSFGTAAEHERLTHLLGELEERGRKPATIEAYRADWRSLARWFEDTNGQRFDLTALAGMDLADYQSFLVRTAKPSTVSRRLLFLRAYAGEAHRRKELSDEAWERIRALRAPKAQPQAPRGLTAEEARAGLRKVELEGSLRDKAIVFTFLQTGLRVGELVGLERRDLEIGERRGTLRVRADVAKNGRYREVPLSKDVRERLDAYLSSREDDASALFVGQRGPMTTKGARDVVRAYLGVSPHRLRHTFAYEYLRQNNNDLVALADILGHESLNTTRHYTRRRKEDLQAGVERVRYEKG